MWNRTLVTLESNRYLLFTLFSNSRWKRCFSITPLLNNFDRKNNQNIPLYTFAKDLFLGKLDDGLLSLMEMTEKKLVIERIALLQQYFSTKEGSFTIDPVKDESIMDELRKMNIFGLRIPTEYGGAGLDAKEYLCIQEAIADDSSINDYLYSHEALGLKGILIAGTESQKRKYLPKLAKGDWIAALCLSESDYAFDIESVTTRAVLSEDGLTWRISGKKRWVTNALTANLFTVVALTEEKSYLGQRHDVYTIFLVERDFGGITVGESENKTGVRGTSSCEVIFKDTPVPTDNILGEVGSGYQLILNLFNNNQFSVGISAASIVKKLIKTGAMFADGNALFEQGQLGYTVIQQMKLAEMIIIAYALESVSYMTAAILDTHSNADSILESAIVKVFTYGNLWHCIGKSQEIFGSKSYNKDFTWEMMYRESQTITIHDELNDNLKLFIAYSVLQHAGKSMYEMVKRFRNPLFNPGFVLRKLFEKKKNKNKSKSSLGLDSYFHPSMVICAKQLEFCILHLHCVTEKLLLRHGQELDEYAIELMRLADIATTVYAMVAVARRASYSMTHGFHNSSYEVVIAEIFCSKAVQKVKSKAREIEDGPLMMNDYNYLKIAKKLFNNKKYYFCDPLAHNF